MNISQKTIYFGSLWMNGHVVTDGSELEAQIMFCLLVSRGSVQVSEWYLLSGVPNQVLNRPSSGLKDACNRTRQNHTQPEGHFDIRSAGSLTLTFEPAAPKVFGISPIHAGNHRRRFGEN